MGGFLDLLVEAGAATTVERGDAAVRQALDGKQRTPPAAWLEPMGGIAGAEASFPTSARDIVRQLTDQYGDAAVRRLRAADARVLRAVRDARRVRDLLIKAQGRLPQR